MSAALYTSLMSAALWSAPPAAPPLERFEFAQRLMGISFTIVLYAPGEEAANLGARAAFARIRELNGIMSDYEPDSELMQLCRTAGQGKDVPLSDDLWQVLTRAEEVSKASDRKFDVTVGPLVKLWRKARRTRQLPSAAELEGASKLVGHTRLRLNRETKSAELLTKGMLLDLGGIAVGYAADEALEVLRSQGITRALVDGSGDISVSDPPPGKAGWRIGIAPLAPDAPPGRFVSLANAAISTSGDAWQFVEIGGKRYSHIVDPATGLGLTERVSVTTIAPDGTAADALATAVCVLGPERGLKMVENTKGVAVLIVRESVWVRKVSWALPAFLIRLTRRPGSQLTVKSRLLS